MAYNLNSQLFISAESLIFYLNFIKQGSSQWDSLVNFKYQNSIGIYYCKYLVVSCGGRVTQFWQQNLIKTGNKE